MVTFPQNTKSKQKQKFAKNGFSSEFLHKSSTPDTPPERKVVTHKLAGILNLGQTIEISPSPTLPQKEHFSWPANHLQKEHMAILSNRQKELKKAIQQLRQEIARLIKTSQKVSKQAEKAVIGSIPEPSEYQISFLQKIKKFIVDFRKNISKAAVWMEAFNSKKRKKNAFWGKVKNKKSGGQQYLFSGEHSASRAAA